MRPFAALLATFKLVTEAGFLRETSVYTDIDVFRKVLQPPSNGEPEVGARHVRWILLTVISLCTVASSEAAGDTSDTEHERAALFYDGIGAKVVEFCEENFGAHKKRIVGTDGYTDLRWVVGCTQDCLRDFLKSGVRFVEAEISEENAGGEEQPGPWQGKYRYFPFLPGKYRYYLADAGDKACAAFQSVADEAYRNRIGLPERHCVATRKVDKFSAEYIVEDIRSEEKLLEDEANPVVYRVSVSKTLIRLRKTGEIVAENSSATLFAKTAIENNLPIHSGDARITCLRQQPSDFLRDVFEPLP